MLLTLRYIKKFNIKILIRRRAQKMFLLCDIKDDFNNLIRLI